MPSMSPPSLTSAKIMATSRPRISMTARAGLFGTLTFDDVKLLVLEQRRRQVAEVRVVLDDQYGSALR